MTPASWPGPASWWRLRKRTQRRRWKPHISTTFGPAFLGGHSVASINKLQLCCSLLIVFWAKAQNTNVNIIILVIIKLCKAQFYNFLELLMPPLTTDMTQLMICNTHTYLANTEAPSELL